MEASTTIVGMRSSATRLCATAGPGIATLSFIVVGVLAGFLAWTPPDHFVALWLLPLCWRLSRRPRDRSLLTLAYYVSALVSLERTMASFYPHAGVLVSMGTWFACATLLWLPYALAARSSRPDIGWITALLVTALPPLGAVGMVSPLFAATASFPGSGLLGLAGCLAAQWLIVSGFGGAPFRAGLSVGLLTLLAGLSLMPTPHAELRFDDRQWTGVSTSLGRTPEVGATWFERQARIKALVKQQIHALPHGSVILTPEDIAGPWTSLSGVLWYQTDRLAAANGDTVLLGVQAPTSQGRYLDALVMLGAQQGQVVAHQPIPIGEWRPFMGNDYRADWGHPGPTFVGKTPVALLVCYEQMLIWPAVWAWLDGRAPEVILAPANHGWAVLSDTETNIQRGAASALGRLFGVPVIFADNVPAPE